MSQTTRINLPAWEGMGIVDEIASAIKEVRPEVEIPCGHPRSVETKQLKPLNEEEDHLLLKYWYPMLGTVQLEVTTSNIEEGFAIGVISIAVKWKDGKKMFISTPEITTVLFYGQGLLTRTYYLKGYEYFTNGQVEQLADCKKAAKAVIEKISIA